MIKQYDVVGTLGLVSAIVGLTQIINYVYGTFVFGLVMLLVVGLIELRDKKPTYVTCKAEAEKAENKEKAIG